MTTPDLSAPPRLADAHARYAWTPVWSYPHRRSTRPGRRAFYRLLHDLAS